MREEHAIRSA